MKVGMALVISMVSTFGLNKKQRLLRRHYRVSCLTLCSKCEAIGQGHVARPW